MCPAPLNFTHGTVLTRGFTALLSVLLVCNLGAEEPKQRKTTRTPAMSIPVYEALTEIQELIEAEDHTTAQQRITELQQRKKKLSPYESAQIWNISAYDYYLQERYEDSIKSYQRVLQQPELPDALQQSALKTLAQLYSIVENFEQALDTVKRLIAIVPEPASDVYHLLGMAYFRLGDFDAAREPIKKAIEMLKEQGKPPRENWLLLLRVCYWELKDFPNMLLVLEELIQHYPKDTYVLTLAAVYSELGETAKQMALTEALYEKGYIDGQKYAINLANLYLLHDLPYKAAIMLEKEIAAGNVKADARNLSLLSQAWYQAREDKKAIPPLRRTAEASNDGALYIRLAQSYINLERWTEAVEAAKKGISMGDLKREDVANLMLGMALLNQKKLELARKAFLVAGRDERSQRASIQWIKHVDSEIRRRDLLEQKLPDLKPRKIDDILKANQADPE